MLQKLKKKDGTTHVAKSVKQKKGVNTTSRMDRFSKPKNDMFAKSLSAP